MEMNSFRPELHVAQQSRRDKLRITQQTSSIHHFDDFPSNLHHSPVHHPELNPDLVQVRTVRNANFLHDPGLVSSGLINFSLNPSVFSSHQRDGHNHDTDHHHAMLPHDQDHQFGGVLLPNRSSRIIPPDDALFASSDGNHHHVDPQGYGTWKVGGVDQSQQMFDWTVSYGNEQAGKVSINNGNQASVFVGEVLSSDVKVDNISLSSTQSLIKPNGCQPTLANSASGQISTQDGFNYQNCSSNAVTVACLGPPGMVESGRGSWPASGDELALLPSYGNQSNALRFDGCSSNDSAWVNKLPGESSYQLSGNSACVNQRRSVDEPGNIATKGLALSLSSNPLPNICFSQMNSDIESEDLHVNLKENDREDSKTMKLGYFSLMSKQSIFSKSSGKSLQDMVIGACNYQINKQTGPLGPFTGYATILKSSRFLRPAQELLDEFCTMIKLARTSDGSEGISGEVLSASGSAYTANVGSEIEIEAKDQMKNSGFSSSAIYSNEVCGEYDYKVGSSSNCDQSYRPEYQHKKAKLLYLQEEVCRRYKLYHQQMQMVVSSFESVAGLSSATPYVSLALKSVTRNFRSLKNAISEQLMNTLRALGEDFFSGASSSKTDTDMTKLKYMDHQGFQRQKSGGGNLAFLEPQPHVWRPQRGLPERAVAILRAWLFDHFLHPYPTDTDKHMLATQTGLSRSQVSNWFINARVRVWKPMVEEIHMLETKGFSDQTNHNSCRGDRKPTREGTSGSDPQLNKAGVTFECSPMMSSMASSEQWSTQEKQSRLDFDFPSAASIDGSLMGNFLPYQRSHELDIGGLGSVSLTLGLRHGVETSAQQQQQQQQQQDDRLRQQFGVHMIHDFVG